MKTLEEKRKCYKGHCASHSRIESRYRGQENQLQVQNSQKSFNPKVFTKTLKISDEEMAADEQTVLDLEEQANQYQQAAGEITAKVEEFLRETNLRMDELATWLDDQDHLQQLQNSLKG